MGSLESVKVSGGEGPFRKTVEITPEAEARQRIDQQLAAAGLDVQDYRQMNLGVSVGVAVREFPLTWWHSQTN